jgi:cyclopropane fatty-acyl-phospholipid synthase-like methyltransferase
MKYLHFLNPLEWIKAIKFAKKESKFDKSSYDLELFLYSQLLTNNMLHWGYFENIQIKSDTISLKQFEDAQVKYAENIVAHITNKDHPVLDVGCGMGGLSELIHSNKITVESLSPNKNQIEFIHKRYQYLKTHNCKFEQFKSTKKYGTVINSESLQYISLRDAFEKMDEIILAQGRWIVVDYFRLNDDGINKSSHLLKDFQEKLQKHHWNIIFEKDITLNVLPTISFANMYLERFLLPIKHFAYEKLRYKKPKLYYMTKNLRNSIETKINKERASIDPNMFTKEKAYLFFVLEKSN